MGRSQRRRRHRPDYICMELAPGIRDHTQREPLVTNWDYERVFQNLGPADFAFIDPPYPPGHF
jgi:site-specific DNA-adenine methylase